MRTHSGAAVGDHFALASLPPLTATFHSLPRSMSTAGTTWRSCTRRSPTRRWATAAWGASLVRRHRGQTGDRAPSARLDLIACLPRFAARRRPLPPSAACFLDSMATLDLPAWGYGIRYTYGIFKQLIRNGAQVEVPDYWLTLGNPWEIERVDLTYPIRFYGHTRKEAAADGTERTVWEGGEIVMAVAYDNPVPGACVGGGGGQTGGQLGLQRMQWGAGELRRARCRRALRLIARAIIHLCSRPYCRRLRHVQHDQPAPLPRRAGARV